MVASSLSPVPVVTSSLMPSIFSTPLPVIPSLSTTIALTAASQSAPAAKPSFSDYGTPDCNRDPNCAAVEHKDESHRGMVAGIVIGTVAAAVLVFAAYMLWRQRRKKASKRTDFEQNTVWHKISNSGESESTATAVDFQEKKLDYPMIDISGDDLGQPGPAFVFDEIQSLNDESLKEQHLSPACKPPGPLSWTYPPCNPFKLPDRISLDNDGCPSPKTIPAFPQYSSAVPDMSKSQSASIPEPYSIPPKQTEERIGQCHRRHSSLSTRSDGTTRVEEEFVYFGKARTARRHSLTPRVINIVAGSSSSDKLNREDCWDASTSSPHKDPQRDSMRSRSMPLTSLRPADGNKSIGSPSNPAGSMIEGVFDHDKNSLIPRYTIANSSSATKTGDGDLDTTIFTPERGRGMKRRDKEHISYPPSSYPKLGKTMAEVKKTIRLKGDSAFVSTENLRSTARTQEQFTSQAQLPTNVN